MILKSQIQNLKSQIVGLVVLLMSCVPLAAYQGDYGTESVFMTGAGSRSDSMGGAFTALADDLSASFYNPAGLSMLQSQAVLLLHYPLYEDALYDAVIYAYPVLDFGAFCAALYRFSAGNMAGYDINDKATEDFGADEYKASVSYGRKLADNISAGASVNIYSSSISDFNAVGFGADAGILYEPFSFLRAGLTIHNLIKPTFVMDSITEGLPQRYTLGLLGKYSAAGFDFKLTSDGIFGESEFFKVKAGVEIGWAQMLAVRAGYYDGRYSFGGGISVAGVLLDYAYLSNNFIAALHKFTLSCNFGQTLDEQRTENRKKILKEVRKLVDEKFNKKIAEKADEYYKEAYRLYKEGDYESALTQTDMALEWNNSHELAAQMRKYLENKLRDSFNKAAKVKTGEKNSSYIYEGIGYYINRQYDQAIEQWTYALAGDSKNTALKALIDKAKQAGRLTPAKFKATKEELEEMQKLYYYGVNLYTSGELDKAVIVWKRVLAINPDDVKTLRNLEKAQAELDELAKRGIK